MGIATEDSGKLNYPVSPATKKNQLKFIGKFCRKKKLKFT
jgi:hypothetical protein